MSTMTLPNTPETDFLKVRYERQRQRQQEALRRLAADFDLMPFDIRQAKANTVLWEDGEGHYYEAEAIALAVLNHYLPTTTEGD